MKSQVHIVSVEPLEWMSGYEYALLAVRQLVDSNIPLHYTIFSDGSEWQRVLYTIYDLRLQPHTTLKRCPTNDEPKGGPGNDFVLLRPNLIAAGTNFAELAVEHCVAAVVTESNSLSMTGALIDDIRIVRARHPSEIALAIRMIQSYRVSL